MNVYEYDLGYVNFQTGTDKCGGGCWYKGACDIRVLASAAGLMSFVFLAGCVSGTGSSDTPPQPTATTESGREVISTVTASPIFSANSSAISTVEPTVTAVENLTVQNASVPEVRKEEVTQGEASNSQPSAPVQGGPKEVLGAHLTIYNCVGSTGAVYCPDGSRTASGTVVAPGTAACDRVYMGRSFQIVGDSQGLVWTCLDTGNFSGNLFDLWFYDLAVGQGYLNTLPYPYQVVLVD